MTEWQPIETAPKDRTPIFLYWPWYSRYPQIGYWVDNPRGGFWCLQELATGIESSNPTYWMPLPEPPKERDEQA